MIENSGQIIERTYRAVKYVRGKDGLYDMFVLNEARKWQEAVCQQDIYDGKEYKTKKGVNDASLRAFDKDREKHPNIRAEYEVEIVDTIVGDNSGLLTLK